MAEINQKENLFFEILKDLFFNFFISEISLECHRSFLKFCSLLSNFIFNTSHSVDKFVVKLEGSHLRWIGNAFGLLNCNTRGKWWSEVHVVELNVPLSRPGDCLPEANALPGIMSDCELEQSTKS